MSEPRTERAARGLWWDQAWTLVEGCTRCSAGCKDCWALAMEQRTGRAVEGGGVKLRWDRLGRPKHWRKPRVVAVWNDLLHPAVPKEFILAAQCVMAAHPQHTFIILTKRATLIRDNFTRPLPSNMTLGVTCEQQKCLWRVEELVKTPAAVRFVNAHLFGPLDLRPVAFGGYPESDEWARQPRRGIDWLAIECNRPFRGDPAEWWGWCRSLVEQATAAGVPVWVKQGPLASGRVSHDITDFPESCRVREFPQTRERGA